MADKCAGGVRNPDWTKPCPECGATAREPCPRAAQREADRLAELEAAFPILQQRAAAAEARAEEAEAAGLEFAEMVAAAEARVALLVEKLERINKLTSPGNRTLDEMIRDMGYACDTARAALSPAAAGREAPDA